MTRIRPASAYPAVNRKAKVSHSRDIGVRLLASFQHIAGAANGLDKFVRERVVYLASESPDVDIHDIGVAVEVHVPDRFGDQSPGQDLAGTPGEEREQKELFRSQLQALAGARRTMAQQIDFQIGHTDRILGAGGEI